VSDKDRLHNEFVVVDQAQIGQRPGERHAPTNRPSPGSCLSR
jgi:hypothetical protein